MHEKVEKEERNYVGCIHDSNFIRMFWLGEIVLGVMIAGIGIYLVYALINPEKL